MQSYEMTYKICIYKNVFFYFQVEVRNPQPHIKRVKETRYTTIRYPVFITQVLKPLLTQVETKVKPVFFTKTLSRYTTVKFTVTGIGQVTVTTVKYEKEYVTRCHKKGYHRRQDGPEIRDFPVDIKPAQSLLPSYETTSSIPPPPGKPYDLTYLDSSEFRRKVRPVEPLTPEEADHLYDMGKYRDSRPPSSKNPSFKNPLLRSGPRRSPKRPPPLHRRPGPPSLRRSDVFLSSSKGLNNYETSISHPPLPRVPTSLVG